MKKLKKLSFIIASLIFILTGCESSTLIRTATISEITAAGSENYGVRVSFANDKRFEEKCVDVQVKFSKTGAIILWQENQDKISYEIDQSDEWYSMTTIFAAQPNTETFEKHNKAVAKTYLFNYDGKMEITLRAVAGDRQENAYKTGEILVDSTPISDQFTLKIK